MQPVRAHVHNGRLTLDEPTDLPEGQVVYLRPVEGLSVELDEGRDPEDLAALHAELEASMEEAAEGHGEPLSKVVAELRKRQ
jgi:hypothetical protein